jgi:hypothetical protein
LYCAIHKGGLDHEKRRHAALQNLAIGNYCEIFRLAGRRSHRSISFLSINQWVLGFPIVPTDSAVRSPGLIFFLYRICFDRKAIAGAMTHDRIKGRLDRGAQVFSWAGSGFRADLTEKGFATTTRLRR